MHQNPCSNWLSAQASKADISRHVDVCQISFRAQSTYKSDEDNCDNVFSNSGNSSNTDSSDNEQLHNLNALSRLGILPITVFFLFQNHKIWFTKDIFV